jgi:hypothetical protein
MEIRIKPSTYVRDGGVWQMAGAGRKLGLAQSSLRATAAKYSDGIDLSPLHDPVYEQLTLTTHGSSFYNPGGLFGTGATQPTHAAFLAGAR